MKLSQRVALSVRGHVSKYYVQGTKSECRHIPAAIAWVGESLFLVRSILFLLPSSLPAFFFQVMFFFGSSAEFVVVWNHSDFVNTILHRRMSNEHNNKKKKITQYKFSEQIVFVLIVFFFLFRQNHLLILWLRAYQCRLVATHLCVSLHLYVRRNMFDVL